MRPLAWIIHTIENWLLDRIIGRQCVQAGHLRSPIGHRSWEPGR